ncbi:hypothetical protein NKT34_13590 [Paenibacillus polysaccharolyticus]|uniref:spike base protein, RCAP_Rcc01079 family n=1 Tax=Paenibacillus polysaccharolyticus TaxID=582692 RepID=UPI0020A18BF2|nr:hypothetical protein [Paenibacillus polysaccharolyticus]MCP1134332.1 hypothetical protein [Paenibacillus polysaccharolyticus]
MDDVLTGGIEVTPSNTVNLTFPNGTTSSKAIYLDVSGNVSAVMEDGNSLTFTGLAAGVFHRMSVRRINSTGTTATGIKAMY